MKFDILSLTYPTKCSHSSSVFKDHCPSNMYDITCQIDIHPLAKTCHMSETVLSLVRQAFSISDRASHSCKLLRYNILSLPYLIFRGGLVGSPLLF